MSTTTHIMHVDSADTLQQPQPRLGRLLAVVALMLVAGGLGALGSVAWEEYWVHEPSITAAAVGQAELGPAARSSVSDQGMIGK